MNIIIQCPQHNHFVGLAFAPEDLAEFQLKTSGKLVGKKVAGYARTLISNLSEPLLERASYKAAEVRKL